MSSHRWPVWHLASRAFGAGMRLVPRAFRFRAALRMMRLLTPLLRRTGMYRQRRRGRIDGTPEIVLSAILDAITATGTRFDPDLDEVGAALMEDALASGEGVLVLSPHAMLFKLYLRLLHDRHVPVFAVSPDPHNFSGTRDPVGIIDPSRAMVRVRELLRRSALVCAMIDRDDRAERRIVTVETELGPVYVSDALIRLGVRAGARILFLSVALDGNRVRATLARPSGAGHQEVTAEFLGFVQEHVSHVARRDRTQAQVHAREQSLNPERFTAK